MTAAIGIADSWAPNKRLAIPAAKHADNDAIITGRSDEIHCASSFRSVRHTRWPMPVLKKSRITLKPRLSDIKGVTAAPESVTLSPTVNDGLSRLREKLTNSLCTGVSPSSKLPLNRGEKVNGQLLTR